MQRQEPLRCNWLQIQENTADVTHTYFLHGHTLYENGKREPGPRLGRVPAVRSLRLPAVRVRSHQGLGIRRDRAVAAGVRSRQHARSSRTSCASATRCTGGCRSTTPTRRCSRPASTRASPPRRPRNGSASRTIRRSTGRMAATRWRRSGPRTAWPGRRRAPSWTALRSTWGRRIAASSCIARCCASRSSACSRATTHWASFANPRPAIVELPARSIRGRGRRAAGDDRADDVQLSRRAPGVVRGARGYTLHRPTRRSPDSGPDSMSFSLVELQVLSGLGPGEDASPTSGRTWCWASRRSAAFSTGPEKAGMFS